MGNLLPDHHPNRDFFVCDISDAIPKDDLATMEHPFFSLSTKPDTTIRYYEHNGNSIKIAPSMVGMATVHDKDILIYCASQMMAKLNAGEHPGRTVHLQAFDLLYATNRQRNGQGYQLLKDAFERLRGTSITTNIETNGSRIRQGFGFIDSWRIVEKNPDSGRMVQIEVTLSEWLYNAILGKEVLTISKEYFRLRKPLERRVYEIVRKHCNRKNEWLIGLAKLQKKCGSNSKLWEFRRMVKQLVKDDHLPDYHIRLDAEKDLVKFVSRGTVGKLRPKFDAAVPIPPLHSSTFEKARVAAPRYDIYELEKEWRGWCAETEKTPDNPDTAFVGFCKRRHVKCPNP